MKLFLLLCMAFLAGVHSAERRTATSSTIMDTASFQVPHHSPAVTEPIPTVNRTTKKTLCVNTNGERRLSRKNGVIVVTRGTEVNCTDSDVPGTFDKSVVSNSTMFPKHQFFRREVWVIPLVVLSGLALCFILLFEVFVICKAVRTNPSRRHLFLGQMLLLGLFMCSGLGIAFAATPTTASCGMMRFGVGVSFALVFGTLMVKCVFLISLNAGVYLPASYQSLLLFFAVVTQVAVGAQWLMTDPPRIKTVLVELGDIATNVPLCSTPFRDFLFSLLYVIALLLLVAALALKSKGIRDNYREASYIGLAVGFTVPIWMVWILAAWILQGRHQDACIGFGVVSSAIAIFFVMFLPKGRQLAAMGKDGVYGEDQSDRFSASGYSPSFFHWQPLKGGGGGGQNHIEANRDTVYRTLQGNTDGRLQNMDLTSDFRWPACNTPPLQNSPTTKLPVRLSNYKGLSFESICKNSNDNFLLQCSCIAKSPHSPVSNTNTIETYPKYATQDSNTPFITSMSKHHQYKLVPKWHAGDAKKFWTGPLNSLKRIRQQRKSKNKKSKKSKHHHTRLTNSTTTTTDRQTRDVAHWKSSSAYCASTYCRRRYHHPDTHGSVRSAWKDRITYVTATPYAYPTRMIHYAPPYYYPSKGKGLYTKQPDDMNMYTTLEHTLSSNPNVFFQRGSLGSGVVHPGMMY